MKRIFRRVCDVFRECLSSAWGPGLIVAVSVALDKAVQSPVVGIEQVLRIAFVSAHWALLAVAVWILLGRMARWVAVPFCLFLVLSDAIQWFMHEVHHDRLYGSWIGLVLNSSLEECLAYLHLYAGWSWMLGLMGVAVACVLAVWLVVRSRPVARSWSSAVLALVLMLYGWVFFCMKDRAAIRNPSAAFRTLLSLDTAVDTAVQFGGYLKLRALRHASLSDCGDIRIDVRGDTPPVGVIVIGESAARYRLGIYGYPKDTTPCLSAARDEIVVFDDLVSPALLTSDALRFILTEATVELPWSMDRTLSQLLAKAGYLCRLESAWEQWGQYDGIESIVFEGCETKSFLDGGVKEAAHFDDELLPRLEKALASAGNRPTVVFLHVKGSHFPQANNYPETFCRFPREGWVRERSGNPQLNVGNYDNTVAFTDMVIGEVLAKLRQRGGVAWLVYLSDHGESVASTSFRNPADPNMWEVPFFLWMSPEYRRLYPEKVAAAEFAKGLPLQSDQLFCGLLTFACVSGYAYDSPERNFLSPVFRTRPQRKVGELIYEQLEGCRR